MSRDSKTSKAGPEPSGGIVYSPLSPPGPAQLTEVATGLFWLRMPLPFSLNHINLWLLKAEDGWDIVDCGLGTDATRALWNDVLGRLASHGPIRSLLATHHHVDHFGLAGWLEERCGAALWITEAELRAAREVLSGRGAWTRASRGRFLRRNGLDVERVKELVERHADLRRWMPRLPRRTRPLQDGKTVRLAGRDWQVLVCGGHSVALAALYSRELAVLIPGDQVLPHISPNVSVSPADPDGDPLGAFLASLERLRLLPDRTLVLPAHGRPFLGLHARLDAMTEHHEQRLAAAHAACADGPVSGVDVAEALWPDELEGMRRLLALGESLAHLHHLKRRKLLRRRKGRDGVLRFRC